jgi:hypothetical protein
MDGGLLVFTRFREDGRAVTPDRRGRCEVAVFLLDGVALTVVGVELP